MMGVVSGRSLLSQGRGIMRAEEESESNGQGLKKSRGRYEGRGLERARAGPEAVGGVKGRSL